MVPPGHRSTTQLSASPSCDFPDMSTRPRSRDSKAITSLVHADRCTNGELVRLPWFMLLFYAALVQRQRCTKHKRQEAGKEGAMDILRKFYLRSHLLLSLSPEWSSCNAIRFNLSRPVGRRAFLKALECSSFALEDNQRETRSRCFSHIVSATPFFETLLRHRATRPSHTACTLQGQDTRSCALGCLPIV